MKEILNLSNIALLFLAPPGFGKTSYILELLESLDRKIIFLAPLRAIVEEFKLRVQSQSNLLIDDQESLSIARRGIYCTTPESIKLNDLGKKSDEYLFIFDEIHLFYSWGSSFRPNLLDTIESIFIMNSSCLFLSATMENNLLNQWQYNIGLNFNDIFILNCGNLNLINKPKFNYWPKHYAPTMKKSILAHIKIRKNKTFLIFFKRRKEVFLWERILKRNKINFLSCVGGEAYEFSQKISSSKPQVIISTSVLSHGINLPSLDHIYITYEVNDESFFIQMLARGGRKGEFFDVHCFDIYKKESSWLLLKKIKNVIEGSLRYYLNLVYDY